MSPMKITIIDGVTSIRLDDAEELPAALKMLSTAGLHHIEIDMPSRTPALSAPTASDIPPVVAAPVDPAPAAITSPHPDPHKYPVASIGTVYVTPRIFDVLPIFWFHPGGLKTREVVEIKYAAHLNRITDPALREYETSRLMSSFYSKTITRAAKSCGLLRLLPGTKVWVLSDLGKIASIEVTERPLNKNRKNTRLKKYLTGLNNGVYD